MVRRTRARRIPRPAGAAVWPARGGPGRGRGGGPRQLRVHAGAARRGGRGLPRGAVGPDGPGPGPVRPSPAGRRPGGGLHRVLGAAALARPRRAAGHRDRLHLARRVGAGLGHQRRGQAAADEPRLRPAAGGAGGPEDRRPQPAVPPGHRGSGRDLRGRAAQLVPVLGARRGGPATRLGHVLGHRPGMGHRPGAADPPGRPGSRPPRVTRGPRPTPARSGARPRSSRRR